MKHFFIPYARVTFDISKGPSLIGEKKYRAMLTKVEDLEEGFINGKLEQKSVAGETYYFIPQNQLP